MIQSVILYRTNRMSVEGPYHSRSHSDRPRSHPHVCSKTCAHGIEVAYGAYQHYTPPKRSFITASQGTIMPVSTSSQSLLASLPSFMSVFGDGPDRLEVNEGHAVATQSPVRTHTKRFSSFSNPFARRDSTSTFESTESSPTTTISTIESSLTEPSPQSPPESPDSSLPLPSFRDLRTKSVPGRGIMGDQERKEHFSSSFPILPGVDRAESPNKKMRNMKNLSVNTSSASRQGSQLPKLGFSNQSAASHASSAPPTPAFIVPPKVPRKKPSTLGLTITTPEACSTSQLNHEKVNPVPQTSPNNQIRTLRALQTSTNGPLFSPTIAPEGGMRLPPFSNPASIGRSTKTRPPLSVSPQVSFDNPASSPITRQTLDHVQEETDYDVPLSQEVKSPAYPQGPVCIYDPHVYLYLEPSHVEAQEFDVILNVAREVKNPFTEATVQAGENDIKEEQATGISELGTSRCAGRNSVSEPLTASSERSFSSALESQNDDSMETAPSTPKATKETPEYIHVPWDHNTNVVDDLLRLCELIDNRVRQGKRVLVHCQCGVSRSASLVVAFGLYKNPQLTVQEAYDAVKNRSRWIGPNMNLIYQLSEFKSKLAKPHLTGTSAWHSWRNNLASGRSDPSSLLTPEVRSGLTSSSLRAPPQKSLSALSDLGRESPMLRASSLSPPASAQLAPTTIVGDITPGPSSAPPNMHFPPADAVVEPNVDQKLIQPGIDPLSPPSLMDMDADICLSPAWIGREAVEQKEFAPIGGVAKDLEEVAKDLDMTDNDPAFSSPPAKLDLDIMSLDVTAPKTPNTSDAGEPVSPMTVRHVATTEDSNHVVSPSPMTSVPNKLEPPPPARLPTPSPTLPAGFSSLLLRRQASQGLRQLPIRQESPRLVAVPLPQRTIDPDVPPTPSLLSPRAAEFTASPFHRTAAGDLAGSSVFEQGLTSPRAQDEDPRSPAQRGEAPITRSIFDMI